VQKLEADPATYWSKIIIGILRQHLIDMDEVTLRAFASERALDNDLEVAVTGEGRTLAAIKRMIPAHASDLGGLGWGRPSSPHSTSMAGTSPAMTETVTGTCSS